MRVLADAHIPGIAAGLERIGCEPALVEGLQIDRERILSSRAEALLVRTLTRVDRSLLQGSAIRFVGAPTAGTDHLCLADLDALGIGWAHAPGCNAPEVIAHVLAALHELAVPLDGRTRVGIVGLGHVGWGLAGALDALGVAWLGADPLRPDRANAAGLQALLGCQVVSLHASLLDGGEHSAAGLVDEDFARGFSGRVLVNTARAGLVRPGALRILLERGVEVVQDVWCSEPAPSDEECELLEAMQLPTPHIAGYGAAAKQRGTQMVLQGLARWLEAAGGPSGGTSGGASGAAGGNWTVAQDHRGLPAAPAAEESWTPQQIERIGKVLDLRTYSREFRWIVLDADSDSDLDGAKKSTAVEALRRQAAERDGVPPI
ncbi:MAG: 4-phosphoerythronate dehydrogenase [Gammaproteobacteria bacterium AqS3]|nr:4-phosphoerythronate dehydrogenase [Gammaproteobacteria bacterium AqS3]